MYIILRTYEETIYETGFHVVMSTLFRVCCVYSKLRLSVNTSHCVSSAWGRVLLFSFCLPMSAMSLLKSPYSIYVWFGYVLICVCMSCCMIGMSLISSSCDGIYRCNISHGWSGLFFICII